MAGNGFDYFEVWSHEFDFGTPKMTTFDEKPAISGHFCPNLDFVNSDVVQIQPSRKVELGTVVCPYKAT